MPPCGMFLQKPAGWARPSLNLTAKQNQPAAALPCSPWHRLRDLPRNCCLLVMQTCSPLSQVGGPASEAELKNLSWPREHFKAKNSTSSSSQLGLELQCSNSSLYGNPERPPSTMHPLAVLLSGEKSHLYFINLLLM